MDVALMPVVPATLRVVALTVALILALLPMVRAVTLLTLPLSTALLVMLRALVLPFTAARVVVVPESTVFWPRVKSPSISMVLPAVISPVRLNAPAASWSKVPAAFTSAVIVVVPEFERMMLPPLVVVTLASKAMVVASISMLPSTSTVLSKSTVPASMVSVPAILAVLSKSTLLPAEMVNVPSTSAVLVKVMLLPVRLMESSASTAPTVLAKLTSPLVPALMVSDSALVSAVASSVPRKATAAPPALPLSVVLRPTASSMTTLSLKVIVSPSVVMSALRLMVVLASRLTLASSVAESVPVTSSVPFGVRRMTGSANAEESTFIVPELSLRPMVMAVNPLSRSASSVSPSSNVPAPPPSPMVLVAVSGCRSRAPLERMLPAMASTSAVMVMSPLPEVIFAPALVIRAEPALLTSMITSLEPLAETPAVSVRLPPVSRSTLPAALTPVPFTVRASISRMLMLPAEELACRLSISVLRLISFWAVAFRLPAVTLAAPVTLPPEADSVAEALPILMPLATSSEPVALMVASWLALVRPTRSVMLPMVRSPLLANCRAAPCDAAKLVTLLPVFVRAMLAPEETARLVSVIPAAWVISPLASSRSVSTLAGLMAVETLMPLMVLSPIWRLTAVTVSSSASESSRVLAALSVAEPRSIASILLVVSVTTALVAEIVPPPRFILSAVRSTPAAVELSVVEIWALLVSSASSASSCTLMLPVAETSWLMVTLPVSAFRKISPLPASMPATLTVPTVKPVASTKSTLPLAAMATVSTLFVAAVRATVPVALTPRLAAVMSPVWLTFPAFRMNVPPLVKMLPRVMLFGSVTVRLRPAPEPPAVLAFSVCAATSTRATFGAFELRFSESVSAVIVLVLLLMLPLLMVTFREPKSASPPRVRSPF